MAETLGSLCDKLTIVKLKQFHTKDSVKMKNLSEQVQDLCSEINVYLEDSISGKIPHHKLTFSSNKVYKENGNEFTAVDGDIGNIFAELAEVNCDLWHEQEKVYEFENVPVCEKDKVIKSLAILNLKRNQCIDKINNQFQQIIIEKHINNV